MTTLCKTYSTELAARRVVEALRATGVPERDIRLLAGHEPGDARREPVGGFAGAVMPDAPVGTYAGAVLVRRRAAGGFAGDPDQQPQGSFADTDRVMIITHQGDVERRRVTGLRGIRRLLSRAALDDDTTHRAVKQLHRGHAVVLIDLRYTAASEVRAQLEAVPRAA